MPTHDPDCIFCKIANGQIPSRKVYEDDAILAFHDINPAAPVHLLIIPKAHLGSLADAQGQHEAVLGRILALTGPLAREAGAANGYKTIINTGADGGQEVMHVHAHVLGGPRPWKHGGPAA